MGSGTYQFYPGAYEASLQHYGSNLSQPDYDYVMLIEKVGGNATVKIEDPEGEHIVEVECHLLNFLPVCYYLFLCSYVSFPSLFIRAVANMA